MSGKRPMTVLAIDGGGIRGLIPALLLVELGYRLEARGKTKPLHRYFDLIAGTSTGGIIAAGLTAPQEADSTAPAMTPNRLAELYEKEGAAIFSRDSYRRLREAIANPASISQEAYDAYELESRLREHLGQARVSEALTNVLITAYDIENRATFFFKGGPGMRDRHDFFFWEAARATSAAPTYFEPARVRDLTTGTVHTLVDGGVFANDPGMCAYVEACKLGGDPDRTFVVALGTGYQNRPFRYADTRNWGPINWINPGNGAPIISIFMHGQAHSASYHLAKLCNSDDGSTPDRYHRLDAELIYGSDDMDDASNSNLLALRQLTQEIISSCHERLEAIADRLEEVPLPDRD